MTARWARRAVRRDACRARLLHEQVSAAAAARDLRSAVELDPPVSVLSLRCGWNGATEDVVLTFASPSIRCLLKNKEAVEGWTEGKVHKLEQARC